MTVIPEDYKGTEKFLWPNDRYSFPKVIKAQ